MPPLSNRNPQDNDFPMSYFTAFFIVMVCLIFLIKAWWGLIQRVLSRLWKAIPPLIETLPTISVGCLLGLLLGSY